MSNFRGHNLVITTVRDTDFDEWRRLFGKYIDFYEAALPDEQYRLTFDHLIAANMDLYGLVLRRMADGRTLHGVAHFYLHQTSWSEAQIMHLNVRGNGYGHDLIQAVADKATEMGCLRLQWASLNNNLARKLYDQMADQRFVEYRMELSYY